MYTMNLVSYKCLSVLRKLMLELVIEYKTSNHTKFEATGISKLHKVHISNRKALEIHATCSK